MSPNLTSIVTDGEFLNRHQNFSQPLFKKWPYYILLILPEDFQE